MTDYLVRYGWHWNGLKWRDRETKKLYATERAYRVQRDRLAWELMGSKSL